MYKRSAAAIAFQKAQAAFKAGDFATATTYALTAEARVLEQTNVVSQARTVERVCSVVVLAQGYSPDLSRLISHLKPYLNNDLELLVVFNGCEINPSLLLHDHITVINIGFNYGCSGGRNTGAKLARGKFLVFVDDDGVIAKGSISNLIEVIKSYDAVAVRGRVLPKSENNTIPTHYDRGDEVVYSAPDAEGFSIWRREEFLQFGGFDTLLAGHEGVALWSKMFRFYGPDAFLYAPLALLYHDYAKTESQREEKKRQQRLNLDYLDRAYPAATMLKSSIRKCRKDLQAQALFARSHYMSHKYAPQAPLAQLGVSVLTVAKNAKPFIEDYTRALKRQTFGSFEVIFIDCGSNDGTTDHLGTLWQGDDRLRLVKNNGGRAESLNLALSEAKHDICVIANASDISLPKRLESTVRHFLATRSGCVSFAEFTHKEFFLGARALASVRLRTRSLLETTTPFGALSFRKAHFTIPFDVSLTAGCETKWLRENLNCDSHDGAIIPLHQVFRRSDDALTEAEQQAVRDAELDALYLAHEQLLGEMSEADRWCCRVLAGLEELSMASIPTVKTYALRLITNNAKKWIYDQVEIDEHLSWRLSHLECETARKRGDKYKRRLERLRNARASARAERNGN